MRLSKIVEDLIADPEIRRAFVADPKALIAQYQLSERQTQMLLTMQKEAIKKGISDEQLKAEIDAFNIDANEFPPASGDFVAEAGGLDPQYPHPTPGIFRYRLHVPFQYEVVANRTPPPANLVHRGFSAGLVNELAVNNIELTVFCQSYIDADLSLVRVGPTPGTAVQLANSFFKMGTFRNKILRAVFGPPGSAGAPALWAVGEEYEVVVTNHYGNAPENRVAASTNLWVLK